jgi:hypothetical protein
MLHVLPQVLTWSSALLMNCDRSTRAATTRPAALNAPSCFDRTTALISMNASSLLPVPLLLLHRLQDTTMVPNLGRSFAERRENAGAIDRSCAGDKGPGAGPATTGMETTRGAHCTALTASLGWGRDWMLNMTRVATCGSCSSMLLWPAGGCMTKRWRMGGGGEGGGGGNQRLLRPEAPCCTWKHRVSVLQNKPVSVLQNKPTQRSMLRSGHHPCSSSHRLRLHVGV